MNRSERHAEKVLRNMGYINIAFEPDGNVPPDFVVDNRIAVEVRRLNQMHESDGKTRGLEEAAIPLWGKLEKLLRSFGPATTESWFVCFSFSRPIKPWKRLKPELIEALQSFIAMKNRRPGLIYDKGGFDLRVIRASNPLENIFLIGSSTDEQSGGFVVSEMIKSYAYCVEEKTKKVAPFKSKYSVWWLMLIDHIGHGIDSSDQEQFLAHVTRPDEWHKVFVIDPHCLDKWFEI